jgi:hypothetical protein
MLVDEINRELDEILNQIITKDNSDILNLEITELCKKIVKFCEIDNNLDSEDIKNLFNKTVQLHKLILKAVL